MMRIARVFREEALAANGGLAGGWQDEERVGKSGEEGDAAGGTLVVEGGSWQAVAVAGFFAQELNGCEKYDL